VYLGRKSKQRFDVREQWERNGVLSERNLNPGKHLNGDGRGTIAEKVLFKNTKTRGDHLLSQGNSLQKKKTGGLYKQRGEMKKEKFEHGLDRYVLFWVGVCLLWGAWGTKRWTGGLGKKGVPLSQKTQMQRKGKNWRKRAKGVGAERSHREKSQEKEKKTMGDLFTWGLAIDRGDTPHGEGNKKKREMGQSTTKTPLGRERLVLGERRYKKRKREGDTQNGKKRNWGNDLGGAGEKKGIGSKEKKESAWSPGGNQKAWAGGQPREKDIGKKRETKNNPTWVWQRKSHGSPVRGRAQNGRVRGKNARRGKQ